MSSDHELLYGFDTTNGIVSVDVWGNAVYEYIQDRHGKIHCKEVLDYSGWYLTHSSTANLIGENRFNTYNKLGKLSNLSDLYNRRNANPNKSRFNDEFIVMSDKASMYMIETGKVLFRGMSFEDVHTLGFDIETTGLDPINHSVKMISIYDNRGFSKVLHGDEAIIIRELIEIIKTQDPTILLTYNGFGVERGFDLNFLMTRGALYDIQFKIGRNNSLPIKSKITLRLEGQNTQIDMWRVFGRHCIDLMYATMKFDQLERTLNNYQLKNVIAQYGLEEDGRVHLNHQEIFEGLRDENLSSIKFQNVIDYCLMDSKDLLALHRHICQAEFYLAQMIPINYYKLMFTGNAGRFNALMLRAYLKAKEAVPMYGTDMAVDFEGGQVEQSTGIFKYVGDSDLTSMYPSIMIFNDIFPASDSLGCMKGLLIQLRNTRIKLKRARDKEVKGSVKYNQLHGQQNAMKVCINGGFGIMSSIGFYWRDNDKAVKVTKTGRDLILKIKAKLESLGYQITALDTDGVSYTNGQPIDLPTLTTELKSCLPLGMYSADEEGIESKIYKGMMVFKKKNYCALNEDDSIMYKGSALTSSTIPPVVKKCLHSIVRLLFNDDFEAIKNYYTGLKYSITNNQLAIAEFAGITKIKQTIEEYRKSLTELTVSGGKRAIRPVYECAIRTNRDLTIGDKVAYYYAKTRAPKKLTVTQARKETERASITPMFAEFTYEPPQVDVKQMKWIDEYDDESPDIHQEHYINSLESKIEDIFFNLLGESKFNELFALETRNVLEFRFKDYDLTENGVHLPWVRRSIKGELNLIKELADTNRVDVFSTIQTFRNSEPVDGERMYHPLYFDLDSPDLQVSINDAKSIYNYFVNVVLIEPKYIQVYFSGSKGFHIEIHESAFGYRPSASLTSINRTIALMLKNERMIGSLDIGSIYSKRRMWRIPFSIHSKTGNRKLPVNLNAIKNVNDLREFAKSDYHPLLEDWLAKQETQYPKIESAATWFENVSAQHFESTRVTVIKKPSWKYMKMKGNAPKCIKSLLQNSISRAGDRNKATMSLLSYFKESGLPVSEAIDRITEWTLAIPSGLTSITGESNIRINIESIAKTIYNSDKYIFECGFIQSVLGVGGLICPSSCGLSDS